jgi:hypothetical protein
MDRTNMPDEYWLGDKAWATIEPLCQSALNIDPLSASKIDPPLRGGLCR